MKKILFVIFLFSAFNVLSQVDNSSLYINQQEDTVHENMPYVKLQGLGYMKDIENFGPMKDGYTIFGYQFNPQIGYQFTRNLAIEGGIYLRKDFGTKDFNEILPTFSIRYHKNDFKMIFGNLDGSLNHGLIEPIYAFENLMTKRMENGIQFLVKKKKYDIDLWINWQNMLYRMVNDYERFWAGMNYNALKINTDKIEFRVPLQGTVRHNGGQIARGGTVGGPDLEGVYTNLNGSAGLFLKYKLQNKKIEHVYVDARYVINKNNSNDSSILIKLGDGVMANIGFKVFKTDFMFTYWYGHDYLSEYGSDLYSSASTSITYAGTYKSFRDLIMLRVTRKIKLAEDVNVTVRAEPQYDLDFKRFNFDIGFYINFDKRLDLKKK